jgi:hypothetical protein
MSAASAPTPLAATRLPLARLELPYAALLAAGALAAAWAAGASAVLERPQLFCLLLLGLVGLLKLEEELSEGGRTSPTTVASLAIAILFGPAGVVIAEAVLLARLLAPTRKPVRALFDFGALGLAGAAAGAVALVLPTTGDALVLTGAAAGIVYFAVNTALLLAVWQITDDGRPTQLWRLRIRVSMAPELAYGPIAGLLVPRLPGARPMVLAVVGVPGRDDLDDEKGALGQLRDANARLRALMLQTVESLARTIEARDPYTGGHTERVGEFAAAIAERWASPTTTCAPCRPGAVIHDVGKIGIPDAVLLKAGPLDDAEWAEMRRHPEIGAYILDELEISQIAKDMTRHHHERYDGNGLSRRPRREEIPLAARILTVADALDAMTSDRPYRKALPMEPRPGRDRGQGRHPVLPARGRGPAGPGPHFSLKALIRSAYWPSSRA